MLESIEHIVAALKAARQQKNLSQRALGSKTGLPQSHISKIENGEVDLQTSSLIELCRVLELELMLIPRQDVLMVRALSRPNSQTPLYQLDEEEDV